MLASVGIVPRIETVVRAGTVGDVGFIDRMQKAHSRELGFLPTMALEGKVRLGQVLVAEAGGRAAGYLIAADRYCRRDEIGCVTQFCRVGTARRLGHSNRFASTRGQLGGLTPRSPQVQSQSAG